MTAAAAPLTGQQVDHYPSRINPEPSVARRHDPVTYADPTGTLPRPLDAEAVGHFDRAGYLAIAGLFREDEARAHLDELARLAARDDVRTDARTILEADDQEIRSVFEVHAVSERFDSLLRDPRLVDAARQLLGGEVYIHQSRVNLKPALRGKDFFWHSDFETWHVEDGMPRMRALSFSIALTENNEFNGPLMVIPGSHHWYVACVGKTPERHYEQSLRRQEYGVPDRESLRELVERGGIDAPKGPAGSVVLFDCNMMHASGVNLSPYPRSNVFAVYNSVENALVAPFGVEDPRPSYIAAREPVPIA